MDYISINKKLWNQKTDVHFDSDFYDVSSFLQGKSSLNEIELGGLRQVEGKTMLHLMCHFGLDTLSWARMGAKVTGIDFSDVAIKKARELSIRAGIESTFIESDLYDLPNHLKGQFDIVYTSYGVLGWLPDLRKWAEVISHYLKPGGMFYIAEFHPVIWMFDNEFKFIQYSYFKSDPIIETIKGTYADRKSEIENTEIGWNHSLAESINSLMQAGLRIEEFTEIDYSPYPCFNKVEEFEKGKYRIMGIENKIPMVFTIKAVKL